MKKRGEKKMKVPLTPPPTTKHSISFPLSPTKSLSLSPFKFFLQGKKYARRSKRGWGKKKTHVNESKRGIRKGGIGFFLTLPLFSKSQTTLSHEKKIFFFPPPMEKGFFSMLIPHARYGFPPVNQETIQQPPPRKAASASF